MGNIENREIEILFRSDKQQSLFVLGATTRRARKNKRTRAGARGEENREKYVSMKKEK